MRIIKENNLLMGICYDKQSDEYFDTKVLIKTDKKYVVKMTLYYLGDVCFHDGIWSCNTGKEIIKGRIDENKDIWVLNKELNHNNPTHKEIATELVNSLCKISGFRYCPGY